MAKRKIRYFNIKKREGLPPRFLHIYDILPWILLFIMIFTVLPFGTVVDFSAPFNTANDAYWEPYIADMEDTYLNYNMPHADFANLFLTSSLQNGGYVYGFGYDRYFYMPGEQGLGYYHMGDGGGFSKRDDILTGETPRGVVFRGNMVGLTEDGQVYIDDLEGINGTLEQWPDEIPEIMDAMEVLNSSKIYYKDLANIWRWTQDGFLIGYHDNTGCFRQVTPAGNVFTRANGLKILEQFTIVGNLTDVMAIEDEFIIYNLGGNLCIRHIDTGESVTVPFGQDTETGELLQLSYLVKDNSTYRIFAMGSKCASYYDVTPSSSQIQNTVLLPYGEGVPAGLHPGKVSEHSNLWVRYPDGHFGHMDQ